MQDLGQLNTSTFFCDGCGISPRTDGECPTCVSITRAAWRVKEPLPLKVHIAFTVALAALVVGIVIAFRI